MIDLHNFDRSFVNAFAQSRYLSFYCIRVLIFSQVFSIFLDNTSVPLAKRIEVDFLKLREARGYTKAGLPGFLKSVKDRRHSKSRKIIYHFHKFAM